MNIHLRFFASVREALGLSEETVSVPEAVMTVGQLRSFLMARGQLWEQALSPERRIKMACNFAMATEDALLTEGCEVAFFPPVTGG
ncbi:MAG: molybdopterin converting factor subunit 1 [Oxalobacter sp.]|nr:molybdopterin converting factor subunit 1 [Oxalobacter sp.]